jgi:hypothetical protein
MKIAIGFYGITRSLKHTIKSINQNILQACKRHASINVYAHFYEQQIINNPRTREQGSLDPDEWRLLQADQVQIDKIDESQDLETLSQFSKFGNSWEDEGQSTLNIIRQLDSLKKLTQLILRDHEFNMVIFVRPDMYYHDEFPILEMIQNIRPDTAYVPGWAFGGGVNDRFSICGKSAYLAYGQRIDDAVKYCMKYKKPVHSERLLLYALARHQVRIRYISTRATRIRSNAVWSDEFFNSNTFYKDLGVQIKCMHANCLG